MLNIFNYKKKNNQVKDHNATNENFMGIAKHFPAASKEWINSIYVYNKNIYKLLPIIDKTIISIVDSYFNLYSTLLDKKIKFNYRRKKIRKLSLNRILVSLGELKHTNDKITLSVYMYNRQYKFYTNKIKKLSIVKSLQNSDFIIKTNILRKNGLKLISLIRSNKEFFIKSLKWKNSDFANYENKCYKEFITKSLRQEMLYMYYRQLSFINRSKFNDTYITGLTSLLEKIYRKKIDFNIVNLKYYYLNSHILSNIIVKRLRKRRNRIIKVLSACLSYIKVPHLSESISLGNNNIRQELENTRLNNIFYNKDIKHNDDYLNFLLTNNYNISAYGTYTNDIEDKVIKSLRYKILNGVRIEAAGRLTKRITAARSIFKIKYKGSLKNIDYTYKNLPSAMLRGNSKSNLQHSKLVHKTRIGSFGIKGWISGY